MTPLIHAASLLERTCYHEAGHTAAAVAFGIPIVRVSVANATPAMMHRGNYRAPTPDLGLEAMVTLCLAGPASEEMFCGPITDGGGQTDYEMARRYLSRRRCCGTGGG